MNRIKTTSSLFTAVLAAGLLAAPGCATSDDDGDGLGPDESVETAALTAISCGPTASDTAIANELKSVWGGNLTGARIACGRRVVAEVAKRGLSQRAAEIATETILVESGMQNLDGGDRDSVGLFQQRAGWGTFAQRTNPEHATDAFLDEMLRIYPNNSWASKARGTVAQGVQRSAFPDRYEAQTSNAIAIVAKLWGGAASTGWDEVVRADLDGNGNDELGFYTKRDGTFSWYPMATDGKLGTRLSSATIGTSWDVVLGIDADGDGADSVGFYDATSGAYAVYVASNAGVLGTKRSQTTLSTGWTSVVAADFTGDSKDEVAFYNSKTGGYAVYATNTDGSLASSLSTTTLGTGWTSVVATDVTGDGHPELVFYNATNGAYAVYAVTATGALGTRLAATTLSKDWSSVQAVQATGTGTPQLSFYNRTSGAFSVYAVTATGTLGTLIASYTIN